MTKQLTTSELYQIQQALLTAADALKFRTGKVASAQNAELQAALELVRGAYESAKTETPAAPETPVVAPAAKATVLTNKQYEALQYARAHNGTIDSDKHNIRVLNALAEKGLLEPFDSWQHWKTGRLVVNFAVVTK